MNTKGRLLELDCLRGLAALLVVCFHFTLNQPELKQYFRFGCVGVDLFFIISGFVIFLTIEKRPNYREFIKSRLIRLFPTYWAAITLTTISILSWSYVVKQPYQFATFKDYMINLTMIQRYFKTADIDVVYWTLLVELLFYLFIVILSFFKKIGRIQNIGAFGVLVSLIYELFVKTYFPVIHNSLNFYFPLINFLPLFIAGITFYKLKFSGFSTSRITLIIFCYVTQITLFHDTNKMLFTMSQIQYSILIGLFFSLFFLYSKNKLNFIVNRYLLFVGKISYSLYLTHNYIAFNLLIPLLTLSKHIKLNYWIADFIIVFPVMIFVAFLVNKYIEVPFSKYIKLNLAVAINQSNN